MLLVKYEMSEACRSVNIGMEFELLLLGEHAHQSIGDGLLHPWPPPCRRFIGVALFLLSLVIDYLLTNNHWHVHVSDDIVTNHKSNDALHTLV